MVDLSLPTPCVLWNLFPPFTRVHSQKCSLLVSPRAPHLRQNQLHFLSSSFSKNVFYWSIVDLQCPVSFCCMVRWFSYTYMCILFKKCSFHGLYGNISYVLQIRTGFFKTVLIFVKEQWGINILYQNHTLTTTNMLLFSVIFL